MGNIISYYDPKLELSRLKYETVSMIRISREVHTIKNFVKCYEILDLTDQINRPWDLNPGKLTADLPALWELQQTVNSMLIHQDPTADKINLYNVSIKKLIHFWRMTIQNSNNLILG